MQWIVQALPHPFIFQCLPFSPGEQGKAALHQILCCDISLVHGTMELAGVKREGLAKFVIHAIAHDQVIGGRLIHAEQIDLPRNRCPNNRLVAWKGLQMENLLGTESIHTGIAGFDAHQKIACRIDILNAGEIGMRKNGYGE
ncbi:hypothetical protein UT4_19580 [Ferrigenium sp. UT4]